MRGPRLYTTSADYVYQELRQRIITKQLKPGQRLPELNLAVEMGVSRTPVREALRKLSSEGLVDLVPHSGARLAMPSRAEMEDAYRVRAELEAFAARLAVANTMKRHLRRLEELLFSEKQAFRERDLEHYLQINEAFHCTIAEASGNRVLGSYIKNVLARTNVYVVFYDPFYELEHNPSVEEHSAIIEALRARDTGQTVHHMEHHLALSLEILSGPQ
ncbi:MAG: GntR family transcriptional regulator [Synergistales bacterium]|nr:GntR family transcriptional regulator [Synergistales bacterium]